MVTLITAYTDGDAPDHNVPVFDFVLANEADTYNDPTEISQVKDVMWLGGRRQETGRRLLVYVHYRFH